MDNQSISEIRNSDLLSNPGLLGKPETNLSLFANSGSGQEDLKHRYRRNSIIWMVVGDCLILTGTLLMTIKSWWWAYPYWYYGVPSGRMIPGAVLLATGCVFNIIGVV